MRRLYSTVQALFVSLSLQSVLCAETVGIFADTTSGQIQFAVGDIESALKSKGFDVEKPAFSNLEAYPHRKVVIALGTDALVRKTLAEGDTKLDLAVLGEQAFELRTTMRGNSASYWVLGGDLNGAMYGGLQIAENIQFYGFGPTFNQVVSPRILRRGSKLNFAFDGRLPTYAGNFFNSSALSVNAVWDLDFWKEWIDEQARNRYNLLTVWVNNPFPAMVKVPGFEKATLTSIEGPKGYAIEGGDELTVERRIAYWKEVMQYAHQRGFAFYILNWNVCPDFAKDQYPAITDSQSDPDTKKYFNSAINELLKTYPDLDGFGVSAGDNTGSDKKENADWTYEAYSRGLSDFAKHHSERKFTFIHRLIKVEYEEVRDKWKKLIAECPNMQFDYSMKYCNANTYSTTTPQTAKWDLRELVKDGGSTWLTLRNDGFFYFDFGHPQFVRDFVRNLPDSQYTDGPHRGKDCLRGIYLGHDAYSPTRSYFYKDSRLNNVEGTDKPMLEIQRKWYMEKLWGRLAYDIKTPDEVFQVHLAQRYPQLPPAKLFEAWSKASSPISKIEELVQGTWNLDSEFYAELCMWRDDGENYFRTIDDFSYSIVEENGKRVKEFTEVANGSEKTLASIKESADEKADGRKTSYEVADEIEQEAREALQLVASMTNGENNPRIDALIETLKQQAFLTIYYAYKIRGATYKEASKTQLAQQAMGKAVEWWMRYVDSMDAMYLPDKFRTYDLKKKGWHVWDEAVLKEFTDLGGVGISGSR